ncbi:hypothetical protein HYDPIDRAFT_160977 [Hydnomerulius pinastri MD-312]|uniref:DNA polymerase delta subunit 3 n=1 Tax=Hydnomerulius pinastri MD-312 TaxID=994086 RepID=A0A0C9W2S4_9AGAM|nr:hypothetical protein HYDPIDRAFT_160977 [Hydnomerulius pinastri MD-312]
MMTTPSAQSFLQKELHIKRSVVTFRSLSRELGIHVNDAKNELKAFYEATQSTDTPAVPTYLICGEIASSTRPSSTPDDYDMEVDFDGVNEPDVVYESKVMLVDAKVLDETMSQFSRIHSIHVYSLSPSRLVDAGLICAANISVRNADAKSGADSFPIVGKVTGIHVQIKAGGSRAGAASSSKTTLDAPVKSSLRAAASLKSEQPDKGKGASETKEQSSVKAPIQKTESKDKPKASGKLDFSKAKGKDKEPVAEKPKEAPKPKVESMAAVSSKEPALNKKSMTEPEKVSTFKPAASSMAQDKVPQRGTKRKSRSLSHSESESDSTSAKSKPAVASSSSKIKKGVVVSDDEEESGVRIPGRRRPKAQSNIESDSEMSLRAMMDIDDEQVIRASRLSKVRTAPVEEEEEESDVAEDATAPPGTSDAEELDDDEPVVPLKKRKPRKVVPVGRNGLKKRRVVKSRTTTDAKGYMQTEDYSSYESVGEAEETEPEKPKGKKKAAEPKLEEAKPKASSKEDVPAKGKSKSTPRARGGAPKRGGLLNFFGPDKGKK